MKAEMMWAIIGTCGLYTDTAFTRRDMITKHTSALGKTWDYCKRKGDRAVRVMVVPLAMPTRPKLSKSKKEGGG